MACVWSTIEERLGARKSGGSEPAWAEFVASVEPDGDDSSRGKPCFEALELPRGRVESPALLFGPLSDTLRKGRETSLPSEAGESLGPIAATAIPTLSR